MKREIEAKVKVNNLKAMAVKMWQVGALYLHTVGEQDIYFDDAHKTLLKSKCGLRLRKREKLKGKEEFFLTFKGPTGRSLFKSREELQVQVDDFDMMKNILRGLGYKGVLIVRKIRQIWKLGQCEICLDKVRGLGTFIEIEGPNEKIIAKVLEKLGLDKTKHIPSGYARMLAKKRHVSN